MTFVGIALPKRLFPQLPTIKELVKMVEQATQKSAPNQWTVLIIGGLLTFVLGAASSGFIGLFSNATQLTQVTTSVANMQQQLTELKQAQHDSESRYVSQIQFEAFMRQYDAAQKETNDARAESRQWREDQAAKIDAILARLNARR